MKNLIKIITIIAFMLCTATVINAQVVAYQLYVAGVQVTSQNASNITGAGISGKVSYDDTTNTLTLNGATITTTYNGISCNASINNIKLIGNNNITITSDNSNSIFSLGILNIKGPGKINIVSRSGSAINSNGSEINLEDGCHIIAKSDNYGLVGSYSAGSLTKLKINNSTVEVTGSNGSIYNFQSLTMIDCKITSPYYVNFDPSAAAIVDNGYIYKGTVVISPTIYPLWIAGVQVKESNASNITGAGISGKKISYEHSSRTLTLDSATLTSATTNAIRYDGTDSLNIIIMNNNKVTTISNSVAAIHLYAATKIKTINFLGYTDGYLTVSGKWAAINYFSTLTIEEDCNVNFIADGTGIYGYNSLIINAANVEATGSNSGSIQGMSNLILKDCKITSPSGAAFNSSLKAVAVGNNKCKTTVSISSTKYPLYIADKQLNEDNSANFTSASISGSISYDNVSNTLTLNNVSISSPSSTDNFYGIGYLGKKPFIIKLLGNNTITKTLLPVTSSNNLTFKGNGSLTVTGNSGINIDGEQLNVTEGCQIYVDAKTGFSGNLAKGTILTVNNSTVEAKGSNDGSIIKFSNINLQNSQITSPPNAAFSSSLNAVALGGTICKDKVLISPTIKVISIALNKATTSIKIGESETLFANITPTNATNQNVTWSSSNATIATVDANGKLTGVKAGTATITVTTEDGGKTATCKVTVNSNQVNVSGVALNKTSTSIKIGENETLFANIIPSNATNQNVTWSSSDASIASVDNAGKVTGVKAGTSQIIVKTEDGGFTAKCEVTVIKSGSIEDMLAAGIKVWTSKGMININLKEAKTESRSVEVFDVSGKLVYANTNPQDSLQITFQSGVYIVRIGEISMKIVI